MSTDDRTLLERAAGTTPPESDDAEDDADSRTLLETGSIAARSTTIGGETVDTADSLTGPTFDDSTSTFLSGNYGRPRPREFWTAQQLGQTPPMELIKNIVTRQLTGGEPIVSTPDGELSGGAADVADLIEDIYAGPHHQQMTLDNLITTAVSDLLDYAYAYWEIVPSKGNDFPVAKFKPLPPLQIQHTVADDGDFGSAPAMWWVPYQRHGGSVSASDSDEEALEADRVVVMRDPVSPRSDAMYGQSVATKVREWLELIVDVDVHQKRHFSDSQLPAGFLHFAGSIADDKLQNVEDDIVEASGDPHELVTTATEGEANWIPVGESVVDLEAIQEQEWYFKLTLAAVGLTANEINMVESSGFAKEVPALNRQLFKNVTKPMMSAIFDPQNNGPVERIRESFDAGVDQPLTLGLERFDPVQEQIEREETLTEWREGAVSLNELRGGIGRDAEEFVIDVPELGGDVNVADLPKYVVDLLLDSTPEVNIDGGDANTSESQTGPPDIQSDPVLSTEEAFAELGAGYSERATKQLDNTIDIKSSFIRSTAYADETEFMQITFDAVGGSATYWYGGVPEWRFFNFLRAESKGSYFNKYIRHTGDPGYTYARLE